jgi:hypothetical protein
MSTAHAKLSASGSAKWSLCPGSVFAEKDFPNTTSVFAEEGTAAHDLAEVILKSGDKRYVADIVVGEMLLSSNKIITVTQEMYDYVNTYVSYVNSLEGELFTEHRVDFSHIAPEGFGTSDAIVINGDTITIVDLKYGKGVRVDAENNTQGILYALGAVNDFSWMCNIKTINIVIVQPRLDHISEWSIGIDELNRWGERLKQAAELTLSENAPRVPGEKQCQWCKAKATCPALNTLTESTLMTSFDNLETSKPETLTDEQLRVALDNKKLILAWFDAIETIVTDRLTSGNAFNGYKLVEGRSNRAWRDEDATAAALIGVIDVDKLYTKKLISPAQAEKELGKSHAETLEALVIKPVGAPTLVPESDKRPAVTVSAKDFDLIN